MSTQTAEPHLLKAEFTSGMRTRFIWRLRLARLMPAGGRGLLTAALLVQLAAGVLPIAFILATAEVVATVPDAVRQDMDSDGWDQLQAGLLLCCVSFFGIQILQPVQLYLGEELRRRVDARVRDRLLAAAVADGGIGTLERRDVSDKVANAIDLMHISLWSPGAACSGLIALLSRYLQTLLAALVTAMVLTWWAGVALTVAALTIRFGYRLGLSVFGRIMESQSGQRRRRLYFRDLLMEPGAAKEIRIFGLLPWLREKYTEAAMASCRPIWAARRRIFYGPYFGYTALALLLLGAVFVSATQATAAGVLGLGGLIIVIQASLAAIRIGGYIPESDAQTELGTAAYRAVCHFEELVADGGRPAPPGDHAPDPAAPDWEPGRVPVPVSELPLREIRFHDVTFRYAPGGPAILDGLNLTIPVGGSLGIVGLNGAGKSTLVKLLARFYEPESGCITADGVDIRTIPVHLWQRRISAVFQDFTRFELSVRDNVGFGAHERLADPDADRAVHAALRRAGAAEFVAGLAQGLDTPLSRRYTGGTDLSGGQWQRIAMARALMAVAGGARLLVLDEPTASLDVRAEVAFYEKFLDLTQNLTTLLISHRFAAVRRADRIVVLQHGRVVESGSHDELLGLRGSYATLFTLQAARFGDAVEPGAAPPAPSSTGPDPKELDHA
jgi:ATP-binding cassette, subfamily B, bacterial